MFLLLLVMGFAEVRRGIACPIFAFSGRVHEQASLAFYKMS